MQLNCKRLFQRLRENVPNLVIQHFLQPTRRLAATFLPIIFELNANHGWHNSLGRITRPNDDEEDGKEMCIMQPLAMYCVTFAGKRNANPNLILCGRGNCDKELQQCYCLTSGVARPIASVWIEDCNLL